MGKDGIQRFLFWFIAVLHNSQLQFYIILIYFEKEKPCVSSWVLSSNATKLLNSSCLFKAIKQTHIIPLWAGETFICMI